MDACISVEKEVDKVLYKFSSFRDRSSLIIKNLYTELENLQKQIELEDQGMSRVF